MRASDCRIEKRRLRAWPRSGRADRRMLDRIVLEHPGRHGSKCDGNDGRDRILEYALVRPIMWQAILRKARGRRSTPRAAGLPEQQPLRTGSEKEPAVPIRRIGYILC